MTDEFFYNLYNLFNHEREVSANPYGTKIYFYLDGVWKIHHMDFEETKTIEAAVDLCAYLNNWEFKPTGEKVTA